jgi:peptide/nickel transport system ATP-binding protein
MNLLEVKNLSIHFPINGTSSAAVKDISFNIPQNSIVGIVGESGSGKTVTALSILKLLDSNARCTTGQINWNENSQTVDLLKLNEDQIRRYRGAKIAMIFQEPMSALNPILTCGFQASEGLIAHGFTSKLNIKNRILECFLKVGLNEPERIYRSYPFELSGGQLQRVLIAMAISCNPQLIIADEATTALDVTLQKHVLDLLKNLKVEFNLTVLFISHDLGLVKDFCDEVIVMNRGQIVESGITQNIFNQPKHSYTRGLINCRPPLHFKVRRLYTLSDFSEEKIKLPTPDAYLKLSPVEVNDRLNSIETSEELLTVRNLEVHYKKSNSFFSSKKQLIKAVNQVNFKIRKGETLGLVGESGSGKSTIGKAILNLVKAQSGSIKYKNRELTELNKYEWKPLRKDLQIVFQDPYSALNPRQTIGDALTEPMHVHKLHGNGKQKKEYAVHLLETVGLSDSHLGRYPHQFSGGQRQRVCIARALSLQPKFIVCDEPVSALDVSIQAQILNLLMELKEKFSLSYLFITHDLSVVNFIADRVAVMKNGEIVEMGNCEEIIQNPKSDYTKSLIQSIPT